MDSGSQSNVLQYPLSISYFYYYYYFKLLKYRKFNFINNQKEIEISIYSDNENDVTFISVWCTYVQIHTYICRYIFISCQWISNDIFNKFILFVAYSNLYSLYSTYINIYVYRYIHTYIQWLYTLI